MNGLAQTLTDEAEGHRERVASGVQSAADQTGQQGERAVDGARRAAERIRDQAGNLPAGEKVSDAVQSASRRIKSSARSVRGSDTSSMRESAIEMIKGHPVRIALIALVAVLLIGRALRS